MYTSPHALIRLRTFEWAGRTWVTGHLDTNRIQQPFCYTTNSRDLPDRELSHKPSNDFRVKLEMKLSIRFVLGNRLCERSSTIHTERGTLPCLSRSGSTRDDVIHANKDVTKQLYLCKHLQRHLCQDEVKHSRTIIRTMFGAIPALTVKFISSRTRSRICCIQSPASMWCVRQYSVML